jgi:hypothetical protein
MRYTYIKKTSAGAHYYVVIDTQNNRSVAMVRDGVTAKMICNALNV